VECEALAWNRLTKSTVTPVITSKSATSNGPAGSVPVAARVAPAPIADADALVSVYVAVESGAVPLLAVTVKVNDPLVVGVPVAVIVCVYGDSHG